MKKNISHSRDKETIEAKAKWFQSLSLEERMDIFCQFTDLILENNPNIVKKKYAKPTIGRIQIVRKP
ncbi:hypothetical protein H8E88_12360 [candidate division KSB1 bacterium]|nr:hypothetical protein [candidate division KSB1 bacterium]MBL7095319.1 hypothetical protein [candidate division KSB1 bacterium]